MIMGILAHGDTQAVI